MKKGRLFEAFEKAFEKGLSGEVESFNVWLKSLGINPLKFSVETISKYLLENPEFTVNLEKEIEVIGQFIGFYSKEKSEIYHIPIVGVVGSGKSHLIQLTKSFLQERNISLKHQLIDASKFSEILEGEEEEQVLYRVLDELKREHLDVIFIDSCEKDKDIVNSLRQIANILKNGVVITSWTPEHWNLFKDEVEECLETSQEIHIEPLDEAATSHFISVILKYVSDGKFQLKTEVIEKIHSFSYGIPKLTIGLFIRTFSEAFLARSKNINETAVELAARTMGIENFFDRVSKLSELQILILKHILLERDERGLRPSKLVEILEKDKATVSYHLGILNRSKFIKLERIGRSYFYRIKDEVKPLIQLKIMQEGEYLA